MATDPVSELAVLVASRFGVLVAQTRDEVRATAMLTEVARRYQIPLWTWSASKGLAVSGGPMQTNTLDVVGALAFVRDASRPGVFLFLDAKPVLDSAAATRLVKELATVPTAIPAPGRTVVLTGLDGQVPAPLEPEAVLWRLPPPSVAENRALLEHVISGLTASGIAVSLTADERTRLARDLAGLTRRQAQQLIVTRAVGDGKLGSSDLPELLSAKAQLLAADSPLDLILNTADFSEVGGLDALKAWLAERGRGFDPRAAQFGLEPPRGILLTGVPGTGKSLVAKALAGEWGMALVGLDTGRLHGSLVGQSEANLRAALAATEAMAPVVLWIDEVEKAFGGNKDNDSGVSSRTLGIMLRWLQERPPGIFVVATCNDITALPPELTRRGRFDEVFFVDLPDTSQRTAILAAHLAKRGWQPDQFDLEAVAAATDGYSGAELESAVVGCLYASFAKDAVPTSESLLAEAKEIVPLSVLRAEDIAGLREWSRGRALRA